MQENTQKENKLGTAPLGRLMVSLALPSVAAQLINILYNIVDRIYIGHIRGYGDVALTGVGVRRTTRRRKRFLEIRRG